MKEQERLSEIYTEIMNRPGVAIFESMNEMIKSAREIAEKQTALASKDQTPSRGAFNSSSAFF